MRLAVVVTVTLLCCVAAAKPRIRDGGMGGKAEADVAESSAAPLDDFDARVAKLKSVDADEKLPTLPELPSLDAEELSTTVAANTARHAEAFRRLHKMHQAIKQEEYSNKEGKLSDDKLMAVFEQQRKLEHDAAKQIQEAATRAKKRHTDLLEIKLRKMAASSDKAHKRATAATAKAAALARRAKTLKEKREAAEERVQALTKQVKLDGKRFRRATVAAKKFTHKTLLVAKSRIQRADEEAAEMVRAAVAKSKAMKLKALKDAKDAVKKAVQQATVLKEDARSELASDTRKTNVAIATENEIKADFEEAEAQVWKAMDQAEHAKAVAHSKAASVKREAALVQDAIRQEEAPAAGPGGAALRLQ